MNRTGAGVCGTAVPLFVFVFLLFLLLTCAFSGSPYMTINHFSVTRVSVTTTADAPAS